MRPDEIRELPNEELVSRLDEVKEELFNLRFQLATGQLENYKRVRLVKDDIARIMTVIRERDLGIEQEPEIVEARRKSREERVRQAEEHKAEEEGDGGQQEPQDEEPEEEES